MRILVLLFLVCAEARLEPRLACAACNATVWETHGLIINHKGRAGNIENAIVLALDEVCSRGQELFTKYTQPPLVLKKACFQLLETWDERFEKILRKDKGWKHVYRKLCEPLCEDAEDAPLPEMAEELIRINNKPLEVKKHADGHFDAVEKEEEL